MATDDLHVNIAGGGRKESNGRKDGGVAAAWLMPHPPVVVPEVGRGRERDIADTLNSMRLAADSIVRRQTDVVILVSPHAPASADRILINGDGALAGSLAQFGASGARVEFASDGGLAAAIRDESAACGIKADLRGAAAPYGSARGAGGVSGLDHGAVVPLYFIAEALKKSTAAPPKLVVISVAYLDNDDLFRFGGCVARAARKAGKTAAFIASGDLSHKLTADGPYGYDPAGPEFDKHLIDCILQRDVARLLKTDEYFMEKAAQCGFYGLAMLYGAACEMRGPELAGCEPRVYSYEGTFGVGYAIAEIL